MTVREVTLPRRLAMDVSARLIELHQRLAQKGYGHAR